MSVKTYQAGVKDYAKTYWTPDYVPLDSDLLAVFKIVAQRACRARKRPRLWPPSLRPAPGRRSGPIC